MHPKCLIFANYIFAATFVALKRVHPFLPSFLPASFIGSGREGERERFSPATSSPMRPDIPGRKGWQCTYPHTLQPRDALLRLPRLLFPTPVPRRVPYSSTSFLLHPRHIENFILSFCVPSRLRSPRPLRRFYFPFFFPSLLELYSIYVLSRIRRLFSACCMFARKNKNTQLAHLGDIFSLSLCENRLRKRCFFDSQYRRIVS